MRKTEQNSRRRRQRKRSGQYGHKRSMLAVSFVILLLAAVLFINGISLREKEQAYRVQEAELKQQIEEEKERASEIDNLEQYVGTDEYVEEVAKDKLGLVNENEIIFKAK